MALLHAILLVVAVAAYASPCRTMAAPCDPEAHAEMVIRDCFPGTTPSIMCCNALFGSLTSGMGCICNISRTRLVISAGLGDDDINEWFSLCGGNGDELTSVCSGAQDPLSPPPPPAQGQSTLLPPPPAQGQSTVLPPPPAQGQPTLLPPPPAQGQPTVLPPPPPAQGQPTVLPSPPPAQGQPWFSGFAKLGIILLFILILVFGLLAVVALGGPAGKEAAKLLRTGRDIAKEIAKRLNIPGWLKGSLINHWDSRTTPTTSNMDDPALPSCGFEIKKQPCIDGHILGPPMIIVGDNIECIPERGRWNYNNKRLLQPVTIKRWAVVSFSANCDLNWIANQLINCGKKKGIFMKPPCTLVTEDSQSKTLSAGERVEMMFEKVKSNFVQPLEFLLCVLPQRKNCDIYGPWKKKSLHEMGVVTQCIAPIGKINDQYLTNILLKINAKLGGMNSALALEHKIFQRVSYIPTLILGVYVSHGSPGQAYVPSVVAVVGSVYWPQISRYKASVRTQPPKVDMSDSLFKEQNGGSDEGMISELLQDFYQTSKKRKPAQIIIFRYGVCDSEFSQVMNIELKQITKACKQMGLEDLPKFTVITAQKKHRMQANLHENILPGTVVESKTVHSTRYNFFLWAHAGSIGTHYHVLLDEIGFSADEIQKFVLSMSYLNQRSTTANSVVAPIHYARLAVVQMRQIIKSGAGGACLPSAWATYPEQPQLHKRVRSSMFFC